MTQRRRQASDAQVAAARAVYESGGTLAECAAAAGDIGTSTVHGWARAEGWNRPERGTDADAIRRAQTTAEQRAQSLERAQQRKGLLAEELLYDIEKLRGSLFAPCKTHTWDKGVFVEHELTQPTFAEQKSIVWSMAVLVDKVQLLTGAATSRIEMGDQDLSDGIAPLLDELRERRERSVA